MSGICFIFIELGINGTSRSSMLLLEINNAVTVPMNTKSSVFKEYRTQLIANASDIISTECGIDCIVPYRNSTLMHGRANISRLSMVVSPE